jgi:hypothetical protein
MSPVGLGTMNKCAGEDLQQFRSQSGFKSNYLFKFFSSPLIQIIKIHYRVHKSPSLVPIVRCVNPVHPPLPRFFMIYFNVLLPATPGTTAVGTMPSVTQ